MVLEVTESTFDNMLKTDKLVIIDFWAEWCGPCRMYGPIIEEFAKNNPDVVVGKANVDNNNEIASRYGIRSIPTTIVFKNGEVVDKLAGVVQKDKLEELTKL